MKVTQYGKDAIVVVTGHQLWFVHSIKHKTAVYKPFQLQDACVSFKADMNDFIPTDDWKDDKVVIFSHFSPPITAHYSIDLNVSVYAILICVCGFMIGVFKRFLTSC